MALLTLCPVAAAGDGETVLRIYDVRDLLDRGLDADALSEDATDQVIEGLRDVPDAEGVEIELDPKTGSMIVRTARAGHESLSAWLRKLRAGKTAVRPATGLLLIEAHLVRSRTSIARRVRFLSAEQSARLLQEVRNRENTEVVAAPSVVCEEGSRATISIESQLSFIGDFEVKTGTDGSTIVDPVVETVMEGARFSVKAIRSADGRFATFLIEVSVSSVERPLPTLKTTVRGGGVVEIQSPEMTRTTWRRAVTVPADARAILDLGPTPGGRGERLTILLGATPVTEPGSPGVLPPK
jgi:hypothetical protein